MTTINPAKKFARWIDVAQQARIARFFCVVTNARRPLGPISGAA
jgi:hypothetical protein